MTNRKYLLGLFSIFFITTIFSEGNRILWDFGVVIKTPVQQKDIKIKNIKSIKYSEIESLSQVNALIANPFIPPTVSHVDEKTYDAQYLLGNVEGISLKDISRIKLQVGWLTIQNNFQAIIDMIRKIDLNQLNENDSVDLNYWLANAFLHIGNFNEAEAVILANMTTTDDRFHFLLAMIYESQGKVKEARDKYLNFVIQFPNSYYKVTALIKAGMLGRH